MSDFDMLMREHMDLSDRETLKSLVGLDEAVRNKVIVSLVGKLYEKIVDKIDMIDFGNIPNTRGDFSKIENFDNLNECVDLMGKILTEYKESTAPTDTLKTAIGNMVDRKDIFTEAYTINVELPIVVYNTIALSIEASLSYLIAGSIDYIKTPDGSFEVSLNKTALKHSGQNLLFENLEKFNKSCASGEFDRTMKECIHSGAKNLVGAVTIFTAATVLALSKTIIPILQDCVYFFYHARQNISDYFAVQADLVQMNAANVIYKDTVGKDKQKIASKQMKVADRFRKVSNFFDIQYKKGEKGAKNTKAKEKSKKYKINDITDSAPDTSGSLF